MSLYIKGLNMPTFEQGVRTINIYADGVVTNYAEEIIGQAVAVPPHGRLGDLDALAKALQNEALQHTIIGDLNRMSLGAGNFIDRIKKVPTIIPPDDK